jgi:hypothetical protein
MAPDEVVPFATVIAVFVSAPVVAYAIASGDTVTTADTSDAVPSQPAGSVNTPDAL